LSATKICINFSANSTNERVPSVLHLYMQLFPLKSVLFQKGLIGFKADHNFLAYFNHIVQFMEN